MAWGLELHSDLSPLIMATHYLTFLPQRLDWAYDMYQLLASASSSPSLILKLSYWHLSLFAASWKLKFRTLHMKTLNLDSSRLQHQLQQQVLLLVTPTKPSPPPPDHHLLTHNCLRGHGFPCLFFSSLTLCRMPNRMRKLTEHNGAETCIYFSRDEFNALGGF